MIDKKNWAYRTAEHCHKTEKHLVSATEKIKNTVILLDQTIASLQRTAKNLRAVNHE